MAATAIAAILTAVWAVLAFDVAPDRGVSWSLHREDVREPPLFVGRARTVAAETIDEIEATLPPAYTIRWQGYWFVSQDEPVILQAHGDLRVQVYLDGARVVEYDPADGSRPARGRVRLTPGAHQLVVDSEHRADTSEVHVGILRVAEQTTAEPLPLHRLFTRRPDSRDYLAAQSVPWAGWLAVASWLAIPFGNIVAAGFRGWPHEPGEAWRRIRIAAFPACLGPSQILLFGLHQIYRGNHAELSAPFWQLALHTAPALALVTGALIVVGLFLDERRFRGYVVALFSVGVLVWLQGGPLLADYGALDGREMDWNRHAWRAPWELALWIVTSTVLVALTRRVFPVAAFASQLLVGLNVVVMVGAFAASLVGADPETETETNFSDRPAWASELSRTRNVIHLVLDGFQSDVFAELLERNTELYDTLSGFVFFADHTGAFPTTITSIPAMLTGAHYRNQEPIRSFIDRTADEESLLTLLRDRGFDTDAIGIHRQGLAPATNTYVIPRPYVSYDEYTRFTSWQLADLSAFRHAPHPVKRWLYNGQRWRLQMLLGQGRDGVTSERRYHSQNGQAFLRDFVSLLQATRDRPVYKFLHVGIPHLPVVLDERCQFVGVVRPTRDAYRGQAQCAIHLVTSLLERLRELDLYDRSVIVVSSDHGVYMRPRDFVDDHSVPFDNLAALAGSARALLAVKPAGATGLLRISSAQTSIGDIPATVLDAVEISPGNVPGRSALRLDEAAQGRENQEKDEGGRKTETRTRSYAWYPWNNADWNRDYISQLNLFRITGPVHNGASWSYRGTVFEPGTPLGEMASGWEPADTVDADPDARRVREHAWEYAPTQATSVHLQLRSGDPLGPASRVSVTLNGQEVDRRMLDDGQWHTIEHAFSAMTDGASARLDVRVEPSEDQEPGSASGQIVTVVVQDLEWR